MNKTNRFLAVTGLVVGGLALMSNTRARRTRETERLQNALFLHIEGSNDSETVKNETKQKVMKMSHDEVVTLYKFLITHEGNREFLTVPFRVALEELIMKYNLFS